MNKKTKGKLYRQKPIAVLIIFKQLLLIISSIFKQNLPLQEN